MIDFMCFARRRINIEMKDILYKNYKSTMYLHKWSLIVGTID